MGRSLFNHPRFGASSSSVSVSQSPHICDDRSLPPFSLPREFCRELGRYVSGLTIPNAAIPTTPVPLNDDDDDDESPEETKLGFEARRGEEDGKIGTANEQSDRGAGEGRRGKERE